MLWILAASLAATTLEADFDNDGKKDKFAQVEDQLRIPGLEPVDCVGGCDLQQIDIAADKPGKELSVCVSEPRDWISCSIYKQEKGVWAQVMFPEGFHPNAVLAKGNGFLLTYSTDTFYTQVDKFSMEGTTFKRFEQPFYSTVSEKDTDGLTFTPDRSFPIYASIGGTQIVANVAPKNSVVALLESTEAFRAAEWDNTKRWFLVRLSSGLTGWATLHAIMESSDELTARNSAG